MATDKQYKHVLPEGFVLKGGECDYVIEKVLGKGGFGVTYKVKARVKLKKISVNVNFAVKEYFPDICSREADNATIKIPETKIEEVRDGIKDFINEGRKLQQVCELNPNIVDVNEVFEANGTAYYVLEYLEGGNLRKLVSDNGGKGIGEQQMLHVMMPIGRAVQCLHDHNMLHLDIKPDNIMMRKNHDGGEDEPVLIDFGIATHFNEQGTPTSKMPSQGISAGYSPIEQYSRIMYFDPRFDVYAFSATCLYLLTGKDPIEALSMPADFVSREMPPYVSPIVTSAIERGMSKEKDQRLSSINELLQWLCATGQETQTEQVAAPVPTPSADTRNINEPYQPIQQQPEKKRSVISLKDTEDKGKKNKSLYIILAAIAALVVGLATFFILKDNKKADDSSMLPSEEVSVSKDSEDDCTATLQRVLEEKDNLIDGESVVYALWGNDEHNIIIGIAQKPGQCHHLYKIVKNNGKWTVEYTGVSEYNAGDDITLDPDKMKASRDSIPQIVEIDGKKYFFFADMTTPAGNQNNKKVVLYMHNIENMQMAATATYSGTLQNKNGEKVIECSPASGSGSLVKWMNEKAKNSIGIIHFEEKKAEQPAPVKKVENKNKNKKTINTGNYQKKNDGGNINKEYEQLSGRNNNKPNPNKPELCN